jgi:hypothetical protein
MVWSGRAHRNVSSLGLITCALVAPIVCGCDRGASGTTADDDFLKHADFPKATLAKFSGKVSIDGKPPKKDYKVFVILTDPKHLDENSQGVLPKYFSACDDEGKFGFSTYVRQDGVPAHQYVVTFLGLRSYSGGAPAGGKALKGGTPAKTGGVRYGPPDELKNLYSDPDKNLKEAKFLLDLQPSGKGEYDFDLAVAGKPPVAEPGPHAVRRIAAKNLDWPPPEAASAGK